MSMGKWLAVFGLVDEAGTPKSNTGVDLRMTREMPDS
jgi:hypothetical protein